MLIPQVPPWSVTLMGEIVSYKRLHIAFILFIIDL